MEFKVEEVNEEKGRIKGKIDAQIALIREVIGAVDDEAEFGKIDYKNIADLAGNFVSVLIDSHLKERCVDIMGKRYYDLDADKIVVPRSTLDNIITKLNFVGNYIEDPDPVVRGTVIKDIRKAAEELENVINPNKNVLNDQFCPPEEV